MLERGEIDAEQRRGKGPTRQRREHEQHHQSDENQRRSEIAEPEAEPRDHRQSLGPSGDAEHRVVRDLGIGEGDIGDHQQRHDRRDRQALAAGHGEPQQARTHCDGSQRDREHRLEPAAAVERCAEKGRGQRGDHTRPFGHRGDRRLPLGVGGGKRGFGIETGQRATRQQVGADDVAREIGREDVDDDEDVIGIAGPFEHRPGEARTIQRPAFAMGGAGA